MEARVTCITLSALGRCFRVRDDAHTVVVMFTCLEISLLQSEFSAGPFIGIYCEINAMLGMRELVIVAEQVVTRISTARVRQCLSTLQESFAFSFTCYFYYWLITYRFLTLYFYFTFTDIYFASFSVSPRYR